MTDILQLFEDRPWRSTDEAALQAEIAEVLDAAGIPFEREATIGPRSRIDFLAGDVGIEVKVAGSRTEVLRQLHRYAQSDRVGSLILATTRWSHSRMPPTLTGKPLRVLPLYRGTLL